MVVRRRLRLLLQRVGVHSRRQRSAGDHVQILVPIVVVVEPYRSRARALQQRPQLLGAETVSERNPGFLGGLLKSDRTERRLLRGRQEYDWGFEGVWGG